MLSVLAYYVHNLNPIIFDFGPIKPRWYGLAYLMGFLMAYLLLRKLARVGMLRLHPERVPDMVLNCCIFGVLVGGRLGYCLFYQPSLLGLSSEFPYWGVLKVWEGGMSAHGGIVFTIIALIWFAWAQNRPEQAKRGFDVVTKDASAHPPTGPNALVAKRKVSIINIGDAACMVVPIGLCFGRIANFINGELYGHETKVPWGVKFPSEIYAPTNGEMSQEVQARLPEAFSKVIAGYYPGYPFRDALEQLTLQLHHHNAAAVQAVADILPARHPSQLYEALLEGVLLFLICWTIGWFWRKDGMASGAFLTFYPVMRIIGEQFRVGDTPMDIAGMQISKGVLYSALMMIPALTFWGYWIWRNRKAEWIPVIAEKQTSAPESKMSP